MLYALDRSSRPHLRTISESTPRSVELRQAGDFHKRKTRVVIVPLGSPPKSAIFLAPYYRAIREHRGWFGSALDRALALAFLAWCPFRAAEIAARYRKDWRWYRRTIAQSVCEFVDPLEICLFDLKRGDSQYYMRRFELAGVMRTINSAGWKPDCRLNDKDAFYRFCRRYDLPVPKVHAVVGKNAIVRGSKVPQGDLIIKPVSGRGGAGVRIADFENGHFRLRGQRQPFSYSELLRHLSERNDADLLVTERVYNHPEIAALAIDGLATVRMTTCLNEQDRSELVTSVLRMPSRRGAIVDNIKQAGLIAPVDACSSRLGVANGGSRLGSYSFHPVSGERIEGTVLPFWYDAIELVTGAHDRHFHDYAVIGWDVAITPAGPCLIEGNSKPCVIVGQRGQGVPIGKQRFGELIDFHLSRGLPKREHA